MPLTDVLIKKAVPRDKAYRVADSGGMYLEVMPNGSKYFRLKYRFGGKENRLALGVYPSTTLSEAREKRYAARAPLAKGVDPSANRKAAKLAHRESAANSFEVVSREWLEKFSIQWSASHRDRLTRRLELYLFPLIDQKAVSAVKVT